MHGAVKARFFERVNEPVDDRNNLGEDGIDINGRVVGWGSTCYAKTISIQQCGGERETSRRTNGVHRVHKLTIDASEEGLRVRGARLWSGNGESQSRKRNEGKESDLGKREHD